MAWSPPPPTELWPCQQPCEAPWPCGWGDSAPRPELRGRGRWAPQSLAFVSPHGEAELSVSPLPAESESPTVGVSVHIVTVFFTVLVFRMGVGCKKWGVLVLFSGNGGGCYFIVSVDQKKQKPGLGSSLWSKLEASELYVRPPDLRPARAHLAALVSCFSLREDTARKANNEGRSQGMAVWLLW